jgi:serine/threonine protein kinase
MWLCGQAMNLREITKKVGRNIGLNLPAVQLFTKQLLLALHHFRDCGVLHADIKPDNILINDRHNAVKVGLTPAVICPLRMTFSARFRLSR